MVYIVNKLNTYAVSGKDLNRLTEYLFKVDEIENVRLSTGLISCLSHKARFRARSYFFNDLVENLNCCAIKYADDTVILCKERH